MLACERARLPGRSADGGRCRRAALRPRGRARSDLLGHGHPASCGRRHDRRRRARLLRVHAVRRHRAGGLRGGRPERDRRHLAFRPLRDRARPAHRRVPGPRHEAAGGEPHVQRGVPAHERLGRRRSRRPRRPARPARRRADRRQRVQRLEREAFRSARMAGAPHGRSSQCRCRTGRSGCRGSARAHDRPWRGCGSGLATGHGRRYDASRTQHPRNRGCPRSRTSYLTARAMPIWRA